MSSHATITDFIYLAIYVYKIASVEQAGAILMGSINL